MYDIGCVFLSLSWGGATTTTGVYIAPNRQTLLLNEVLRCQVASSDKGIFARFLLHKAVFFSASFCLF
jgi:hypothetical protein